MPLKLNRHGQLWAKTAPGAYEVQIRDGSLWRWTSAKGLEEVTDIWTTPAVKVDLAQEYGKYSFRRAQYVVNEMET